MPAVKRRGKAASSIATHNDDTLDVAGPSGTSAVTAGSNEASKSRNRRLRGKRGCLQDLPNMPLDIVLEIFVYMDPMDLLNLARTSKDLRHLLLSKSSAPYWKASRKNIEGLPECPSFLSEPAYANLMFSSHCHNCLKGNVKNVYSKYRARYCNSCETTLTISDTEWKAMDDWGSDLRHFPTWDLLPVEIRTIRGRTGWRVLVSDVRSLASKLAATREDKSKVAEVLDAQRKYVGDIRSFSNDCYEWNEQRKVQRTQELKEIRESRLQAVVDKLRESGWGEELDHMASSNYSALANNGAVKDTRPLTARIWNNIRDCVESTMNREREQRLRRERSGLLAGRFRIFQEVYHSWRREHNGPFPHAREFVSFPEVRAVVDVASSVEVNAESFDTIKARVPELVERWVADSRRELARQVRSENIAFLVEMNDDQVLGLAANALYSCNKCEIPTSYPEVLSHCCGGGPSSYMLAISGDIFHAAANLSMRAERWEVKEFGICPEVAGIIKKVDKMPGTTTSQEMDELDRRFTCDRCEGRGVVSVMNWRTAALHCTKGFCPPLASHLSIATQDEAETACRIETSIQNSNNLRYYSPFKYEWFCGRCYTGTPCRKNEITSHLSATHSITEPTDEDYDHRPNVGREFTDPVYIVSEHISDFLLPTKVHSAIAARMVEFQSLDFSDSDEDEDLYYQNDWDDYDDHFSDEDDYGFYDDDSDDDFYFFPFIFA